MIASYPGHTVTRSTCRRWSTVTEIKPMALRAPKRRSAPANRASSLGSSESSSSFPVEGRGDHSPLTGSPIARGSRVGERGRLVRAVVADRDAFELHRTIPAGGLRLIQRLVGVE